MSQQSNMNNTNNFENIIDPLQLTSYYYLTSKDPEQQCHYVKPFTFQQLNKQKMDGGKRIRTQQAIEKIKKRIEKINNAYGGKLGICCRRDIKNPDPEILEMVRNIFKAIREVYEGGKLAYLEASFVEQDKSMGWKTVSPYHVCKILNGSY